MKRTIRPGKSAYLLLGVITAALVTALIASLGASENKVLAITLALLMAFAYAFWCWFLRGHVLTVSDEGITLRNRFGKVTTIHWSEVGTACIPYLMGRPPLQILVWSRTSRSAVLKIPLRLYRLEDIRFLVGLNPLRMGDPDRLAPSAPHSGDSQPRLARSA